MNRPDLTRLRWRLLAANLAVAGAGVSAVVAGVWLAAPSAFDAAMAHMPAGGMMDGAGMGQATTMMDPLLRRAFGDALISAIALGAVAAAVVAVAASLVLATRLARPIDELASATRHVAAGDYSRRVPPADGELGRLGETFNEMAAALASTERRRRDLIADVAHELRTPITSLRGYVAGLDAGVFAPGPESWRVLDDQSARLARLVDDLAVLWRADSHDLPLALETIDVRGMLDDAAARHGGVAAAHEMRIEVAAIEELRLRADATRLAQVLDNLIANAVRYGQAGGTIRLSARRAAGYVEMSVTDDGRGMAPDQLARAFERFYRAESSRSRDGGGSGLGLAISRSLVEAMDGTIHAASAGPGRGSTFTVQLPAV